jgi:hypothetical protein
MASNRADMAVIALSIAAVTARETAASNAGESATRDADGADADEVVWALALAW